MPESPTIQKRTPGRSRVYVAAMLHRSCGSEEVRLRDVSASGALVEARDAPSVGAVVGLSRGQATIEARVAWVDSTWFGVEFLKPAGREFLGDQIGGGLKVSAPRWYRRENFQDQGAGDA